MTGNAGVTGTGAESVQEAAEDASVTGNADVGVGGMDSVSAVAAAGSGGGVGGVDSVSAVTGAVADCTACSLDIAAMRRQRHVATRCNSTTINLSQNGYGCLDGPLKTCV